jgi:glycosyltransferase involved in cell wall biosynthesis
MSSLRVAACVPVYQNPATIVGVLRGCLEREDLQCVIVVDDGSAPPVSSLLPEEWRSEPRLVVLRHDRNLGKGMALQTGFREGLERGCSHVLSIDGDGQHFPADAGRLLALGERNPGSLVIGARRMTPENSPWLSRLGRAISDRAVGWRCGTKVFDSQSGYRLYPLAPLRRCTFGSAGFDFEMEVLVKLLLGGTRAHSVEVQVHYPTGGKRISHFRFFRDNWRIAALFFRTLAWRG